MQVVKLNNPIMVNGNEVKEVQLDFEAIRGKDLIAAEKEVRKMGDTTPSVFLSMDFQALIAAKLIGVPVEDVLDMHSSDFKNLVLPVANFLLG
ncbi:phage tail assembly protein [Phascolarctobacterium succinatutens]|uniref:phage tail assembly protein n=1 Tax=Phascolarctobacterium succinatutens TaxID=626940 RepID=UPI003AF76818